MLDNRGLVEVGIAERRVVTAGLSRERVNHPGVPRQHLVTDQLVKTCAVGIGQDGVDEGSVGGAIHTEGVVVVHYPVVAEVELPGFPIGIVNRCGNYKTALRNGVFRVLREIAGPVVSGVVLEKGEHHRGEGDLVAFVQSYGGRIGA